MDQDSIMAVKNTADTSKDTVEKDKVLAELAASLLSSRELEKIIAWYSYLCAFPGEYIVFLVRRSYILALLMEKITGRSLNNVRAKHVVTDASIYLQCPKLAEYFRENHCFPDILVCDDILIHGRGLNHFLTLLEERLTELLPEYESEIAIALPRAIQIHVYQRADKPLMLLGQYRARLLLTEVTPGREWHEHSNAISTLIQCSDVSNAVYVYTEGLSAEKFQQMDLSQYIATDFQHAKEYVKVKLVQNAGKIKAAFTVRIIRNLVTAQYRVVPFVFLPNLDTDETQMLLDAISMRLEGHAELQRWLWKLNDIPGKRVLNELITYIFSNVLLWEFNSKYGIKVSQKEENYELEKLARNYNMYGKKETKEHLRELKDLVLFTSEELEKLVLKAASEERFLAEVGFFSDSIGDDEIKRIKHHVEYYFYQRGYQEELRVIELDTKSYYSRDQIAERLVKGACFALQELMGGMSVKQMKYYIAFVLQLMDAGALSLSSYSSRHIQVVGFAQFAKAGEQSLLIYPLRWYDYMPMLAALQRKCWQGEWDMKEKLSGLLHSRYWISLGGKDPDTEETELGIFLDSLGKIHQTPVDWNGNYLMRRCSTDRDSIRCMRKRDEYLKALECYLNANY